MRMPSSSTKASGKVTRLIRWELEKTFSAPMLAIMLAVALYVFVPHTFGTSNNPSSGVPSVASLLGGWAYLWVYALGNAASGSYMFSVFVFAAVASLSLSRDISSGYMKALLSYPIGRARLFLSKFFVSLIVPFLVFTICLLLVGALVFPSLFVKIPLPEMAYVILIMLIQMYFMLSISITVSLHVRQPIISFLASVVALIGAQQVCNNLEEPYKYLVPTWGTSILMDYGQSSTSTFFGMYSASDLLMAMTGMIIVPAALLIFNIVYFKWRFQT
jgi:ABC-type transport system involved in multi-copper enzyme maturation permease subunit